jgi:hypothetical protein
MGFKEMNNDGSPFEFYKFKRGAYDFWRCYSCNRIFTYEQERAYIKAMEHDLKRTICSCGSLKYSPAKSPVGLEWLLPNVLTYTLKLILARGVAPWVEQHFPRALPWLERLCKPMEA